MSRVLSLKRLKEIDKRVAEAERDSFPDERFLDESRALINEVKRLKALSGWKKKRRLSRRQYLRLARDLDIIVSESKTRYWGTKKIELAALALRNEVE